MPIYDYDGTATHEIGKVYDYDNAATHEIGKVYDYDNTALHEIFSSGFKGDLYRNGVTSDYGLTMRGGTPYPFEQRTESGVTYWYIVTATNGSTNNQLTTTRPVEISGGTLKALIQTARGYGDAPKADPYVHLFVKDTAHGDAWQDVDNVKLATFGTVYSSWTEISLDLSDLNGTYYIGIGNRKRGSDSSQLKVQRLWIE